MQNESSETKMDRRHSALEHMFPVIDTHTVMEKLVDSVQERREGREGGGGFGYQLCRSERSKKKVCTNDRVTETFFPLGFTSLCPTLVFGSIEEWGVTCG